MTYRHAGSITVSLLLTVTFAAAPAAGGRPEGPATSKAGDQLQPLPCAVPLAAAPLGAALLPPQHASGVIGPFVSLHTPAQAGAAQIHMQFPEGTNPAVCVNFTEYPPAGASRIFCTTVPGPGPSRYYMSARTGDGGRRQTLKPAKRVHQLRPDPRFRDVWFADLLPGQVLDVAFEEPAESAPAGDADQVAALERLREEIQGLKTEIQSLKTQLQTSQTIVGDVVSHTPTAAFRFKQHALEARTSLNMGVIERLRFVNKPQELEIRADIPPPGLSPQSEAKLQLFIHDASGPPPHRVLVVFVHSTNLELILDGRALYGKIAFSDPSNPFNDLSATIEDLVVENKTKATKLAIRALLTLKQDDGASVYGPAGNALEVTLKPIP